MTQQQIKLGGKSRPISFAAQVGYDYEVTTGRIFTADVVRLLSQMAAAEDAIRSNRLEDGLRAISNVLFADIVHAGLAYAARKHGLPVDYEPADVHAWVTAPDATDAIGRIVNLLTDSLPRIEPADGEKKTTSKAKKPQSLSRRKPAGNAS